jgi:hypothetical protein
LHLHQVFLIQSGEGRLSIDGKPQHGKTPFLMNLPGGYVHGFAFSAGALGHVLSLLAGDFPELFGPQTETQATLERTFVICSAGLSPMFEELARLHAALGPLRRLRLRAAAVTLYCAVAELGGPAHPQARPRRRSDAGARGGLCAGFLRSSLFCTRLPQGLGHVSQRQSPQAGDGCLEGRLSSTLSWIAGS